MTFLYPWAFALLIPVAAFGIREWRRPSRRVVFPFDHVTVTPRRKIGMLLRLSQLLPAALAAWAVLLLAAPQQAINGPNERVARHVHFLLDGSASMTGPFGNTTRTLAAVDAMVKFSQHRPGDAFALTLFANASVTWLPLTKDVRQFEVARPFIDPSKLPSQLAGDTETGKALRAVCSSFADAPPGERLIILLTDGFAGDLDEKTTNAVAAELRAADIAVYTVLVAGDQLPPDADRINSLTGGRLLTADDPAALNAVFERIDRMAESKSKPTSTLLKDHFVPAALLLLATLASYALSLFGLRFTPW